MAYKSRPSSAENSVKNECEQVPRESGIFAVAAHDTRIPIIIVNAKSVLNEIVYANQSFLETMGYERDELLGHPLRTIISANGMSVPFILNKKILREREPQEVICLRKDGSVFKAALLASPINEKQGNLRQFFVSLVDLSPHLALPGNEHKYCDDLYNNTPGFIIITNGSDHRITYANWAYEKLVGRRNLRGKTVADALPEIIDQGFIELLDNVYETGEHFSGRCLPVTLEKENGREVRYVDFVYQPLHDEAGKITGLFCEGSDVTELQASSVELQIVQAQLAHLTQLSAMGTMAATLAHELNQPLTAIGNFAAGCTKLLAEEGLSGGPLHMGLEGIALASDRAGEIIRRVRSMTKPPIRKLEAFDVGEALEEAVLLVKAGGCDDVSIEISQIVRAQIKADRIQIQQVMINLLKNACYAAREGNQAKIVRALIRREEGGIRVCIEDSGPGISQEAQKTLFQWTDTNKSDGMGIGLSISRTIIESHNGAISLDGTSSTGTRFSFILPKLTS